MAQTYLDRFEAGTPRAPQGRLDVSVPQAPAPPVAGRFDVTLPPATQPNFFQQLLATLGGPVYPGPSLAARIGGPLTEPIRPGGFREAYRPRGLTDIFGENVALTLGRDQRDIATQAHPSLRLPAPPYIKQQRTFGARRYSAALGSLYQGIRPPFLGFGIQEFMGLTDQEMEDSLGYAKVPGGWVMRPVLDQPLENVYGSGTAAQPQTINVNYGGYGGGGGGTRQQSSYLVNWRI